MRSLTFILLILFSSCNIFNNDLDTSHITVFENLWNEYNILYSLFDIKGVDWDEEYKKHRPNITNEMSEEELFNEICDMLSVLDDTHVSLTSDFDHFKSRESQTSPFDLDIVLPYLDTYSVVGDNNMIYGNIGNRGYLYIRTFTYDNVSATTLLDWALEIDHIIEFMEIYPEVIVDIRGNGGGLPQTAYYLIHRFTDQKRAFQTVQTKNGPGPEDFSTPTTYYIKPDGPKQYTKRTYLLTDRTSLSAAENFTMAMKTLPHVIHVGSPTGGIFSLALARDLLNGWECRISVQLTKDIDGICYEGIGISPAPEYLIEYKEEDRTAGKDTQLDFILGL